MKPNTETQPDMNNTEQKTETKPDTGAALNPNTRTPDEDLRTITDAKPGESLWALEFLTPASLYEYLATPEAGLVFKPIWHEQARYVIGNLRGETPSEVKSGWAYKMPPAPGRTRVILLHAQAAYVVTFNTLRVAT